VAEAALAFNTTVDCIRDAVEGQMLLYSERYDDPAKQTIHSEGE
jgi:hypothetical protein